MATEPPPSRPNKRTTFSFDSSGWMFVYHLGAARYLQENVLPLMPEDRTAFSGSSGGALVACCLCCGIEIEELARFVIDGCQPECKFNPWRLLPCADDALNKFLPADAVEGVRNKLRVLVTRIELGFGRWLIRPEAVSKFASTESLKQTLRASSHVPIFGGVFPYKVKQEDGTSTFFYDGLFWPSLLYMWRRFDASDTLLKVSGIGWPTAHISSPIPIPPHWTMLPPSRHTLWRLYAAGYDDTARYFARRDEKRWEAKPGMGRRVPSASHLPPPSELPAAPRGRDVTLLLIICLGWLHLLVLTVFAPLVPAYLALRNMFRDPSDPELRPARAQAAAAARAAAAGEGEGDVRSALQYVLRAIVVVLVCALWPLALLVLGLRVLWSYGDGASARPPNSLDPWRVGPVSPPDFSPPGSPRPPRFAGPDRHPSPFEQSGRAPSAAPAVERRPTPLAESGEAGGPVRRPAAEASGSNRTAD